MNGRRIRLCACLAIAWLPAATAVGQPNVSRSALTVGGTVGIVGVGQPHSGGGEGPIFSGFVDVPVVPTWRVRVSAASQQWHPSEPPLAGKPVAQRVTLNDVGVTVIRTGVEPTLRYPIGFYGGAGIGYYRYRIKEGPLTNPRSAGVHLLGGFEYQKFDRNVGLRVEVQMHVTGGPGHPHVWAVMVPALSLSAGISKRF